MGNPQSLFPTTDHEAFGSDVFSALDAKGTFCWASVAALCVTPTYSHPRPFRQTFPVPVRKRAVVPNVERISVLMVLPDRVPWR
jgi:hypothetical protein